METFCSYFNAHTCRSCEWIATPYAQQLGEKEKRLKEILGRKDLPLASSIGSSPTGFRNRAKMSVTGTVANPVIGLIGEEDLDAGRELLHCPIHHPKLNAVIAALPEYIRDFQLIPYGIGSRKGELKGLILFHSPWSGETYLRFVLRSKECVSRLQKMLPRLQKQFPELVCVTANLQPVPHAILEGNEEIFITERRHIEHRFNENVSLRLAPQAFVQTNVEVATRLYETAAEWISKIQPGKMLELFCGQGAFSFFTANRCPDLPILGIEINADAVNTANETATRMNLHQVRFEAKDAKDAPSIGADLILVNPPRRGLGESVKILQSALPKFIIYSSCAADTLAKDIQILSKEYTLKEARIFDLFPHTEHFETLVMLERNDR